MRTVELRDECPDELKKIFLTEIINSDTVFEKIKFVSNRVVYNHKTTNFINDREGDDTLEEKVKFCAQGIGKMLLEQFVHGDGERLNLRGLKFYNLEGNFADYLYDGSSGFIGIFDNKNYTYGDKGEVVYLEDKTNLGLDVKQTKHSNRVMVVWSVGIVCL